ncbi:heme ABC exporter ATP-binding protein CcmA [Lacibacterium aquatile]|uniref:Heme ABC exporter ATP-binding protein CcmA n=1 Tax=Lacibacterium aquatile TaxID=1168082 RepID=A0ABW5DSL0_9PROT
MINAASFSGSGLAVVRGGRLLFRDLAFEIAPGQALLLTGPNGSGKSSLLRVLAGLTPPQLGQLSWNGAPIDDREDHAARLNWLGFSDGIKPTLTVREHLAFHRALGLPGIDVEAAGGRVGLGALLDKPGRILSSGQRRRLSLARLLVRAAPLWLLDEPTTALDDAGTALFAELAGEHLAQGGLLVAATHHDLGLADSLRLRPADFLPERAE